MGDDTIALNRSRDYLSSAARATEPQIIIINSDTNEPDAVLFSVHECVVVATCELAKNCNPPHLLQLCILTYAEATVKTTRRISRKCQNSVSREPLMTVKVGIQVIMPKSLRTAWATAYRR